MLIIANLRSANWVIILSLQGDSLEEAGVWGSLCELGEMERNLNPVLVWKEGFDCDVKCEPSTVAAELQAQLGNGGPDAPGPLPGPLHLRCSRVLSERSEDFPRQDAEPLCGGLEGPRDGISSAQVQFPTCRGRWW